MDDLTPWQKYKQNLGDTRPWHILTGEIRASDDLAKQRLDICKACPEFLKTTHQCKKCGCLMNLKVKLQDSGCPIGKW